MNTPICDFVKSYAEKKPLRLHMPGHKGESFLGFEKFDITEVSGADSLYEASGVIRESENNASKLFGFPTYYSTEGSSQCIRAMLYLALLRAKELGKAPLIAAARNAHKTFLSAAALLDLDVMWLYGEKQESYLSCSVSPEYLEGIFSSGKALPCAVYLTSPDYLGNVADIKGISSVCRKHGVMLLIDNAHGAYLKFLSPSQHPIDLGADMCSASAHKTLPVLTGGGYLQLSPAFHQFVSSQVKNALSLFGSTSPSYLIMQSLDMANVYLCGYAEKLSRFLPHVEELKQELKEHGFEIYGNEALKLSISAKAWGYTGNDLSEIIYQHNIVREFADDDYIVFMLTPEIEFAGLCALKDALLSVPKRNKIYQNPPRFMEGKKCMSIRSAALSVSEVIPVEESMGRVLAAATVGCPPAVPILVCGEQIDAHAIECFKYYGLDTCTVIKDEQR